MCVGTGEQMEAEKEGCEEDKPCKLHGARQEEAQQMMMAQVASPLAISQSI